MDDPIAMSDAMSGLVEWRAIEKRTEAIDKYADVQRRSLRGETVANIPEINQVLIEKFGMDDFKKIKRLALNKATKKD